MHAQTPVPAAHYCQDCLSSPSPTPTIITEQALVHATPGTVVAPIQQQQEPHIEHCSCGLTFSVQHQEEQQQQQQQLLGYQLESQPMCQHHHHHHHHHHAHQNQSQAAHAHVQTDFPYVQR